MIDVVRRIYGEPVTRFFSELDVDDRFGYTATEKNRALTIYLKDKSFSAVENEMGIPRNTVREWFNQVKNGLGQQTKIRRLSRDERRKIIVKSTQGRAMGVGELASALSASDSTIRTDIVHLLSTNEIRDIGDHGTRIVIAN